MLYKVITAVTHTNLEATLNDLRGDGCRVLYLLEGDPIRGSWDTWRTVTIVAEELPFADRVVTPTPLGIP